MRKFAERHSVDRLLEIAEDGHIDEEEMPEFIAITEQLRRLSACVMEFDMAVVREESKA